MFLSSLGECFRAVGTAEKASQPLPPPLLLPLLPPPPLLLVLLPLPPLPRHRLKLSFSPMAFLELVTHRILDDVVLIKSRW